MPVRTYQWVLSLARNLPPYAPRYPGASTIHRKAGEGCLRPGKVFDLEIPLADVADGYKAMDERRAIKTLLRV